MGLAQSLVDLVKEGKKGKNKGLNSGFPRLDNVIYGLQKKYITVIAGDSGSGKSSLALYMCVYRPIMDALENKKKVAILYYSFEMSAEILMAKLLSIYIWEKFHKEISFEQLLSLHSNIQEDDYEYIKKSKSWLIEVEKRIEVIDKPISPGGVYRKTHEWLDQFGTFEKLDEYKVKYTKNDPELYMFAIVDHVRLLSSGKESGTKSKIDEFCDYAVSLRNQTGMSWFIVQQLNRGFKSMDRRSGGYQLLQSDDLSDSSGPFQSAEIVLGIFDAYREKMKNCEGYRVDSLMDTFRLLQVLKNRFGTSNKNLGVGFYGTIGYWKELPKPNEIKDYCLYKQLVPDENTCKDNTVYDFDDV